MPVPDRERAGHMALRLRRTAERAGLSGIGLLEHAHALAMEPRHLRLDDDHDPRYLHPGRTALVSLNDAGLRDAEALAAAALLETLNPELAAQPGASEEESRPGMGQVWAILAQIPGPFDPDAAERLLGAEDRVRIVALAEWLDQLRHLRPWAGGDTVRAAVAATRSLYQPVAHRTAPVLARRYDWWMRRVAPGLTGAS